MAKTFDELLADANAKLGRLRILHRGTRLYLRGYFPPKPGDGAQPKRYELATGLRANTNELKVCLGLALEIEGQLIRGRFDWQPYLKGKQKPAETVGEWLLKLEAAHWQVTPKNPNKLNSWYKNYQLYYAKLPLDKPLTLDLLTQTVCALSRPATRAREFYCLAYRRLAKFAGLPDDTFMALAAGYKPKPISSDKIPTDEQIITLIEQTKDPGWRWAIAMMATYGLRNHELWQLDCRRMTENPPVLLVKEETKTGQRLVWPRSAEWVDRFNLRVQTLPPIKAVGLANNRLGEKVTRHFQQRGVPFSPYRLRDAYARELAVMGVDLTIAARWMGHSEAVHSASYLDILQERDHLRVYQLLEERQRTLNGLPAAPMGDE